MVDKSGLPGFNPKSEIHNPKLEKPVSDEAKPSSGPFDISTVRDLVRLMRRFDLSEVDLQDGDKRVKLRRGPRQVAAPPAYVPPPTPITVAAPTSNPGTTHAPGAPTSKLLEIKSPMVGTFYSKPAPDKDDYVKVSARVNPETVVCKVEAMKIFNDLPAGCNGVIAEVCVQNGEFVEYDQVLFRVEPS
jgi:acetyl-CoA carboxylase biotin carboxyl carrier protein